MRQTAGFNVLTNASHGTWIIQEVFLLTEEQQPATPADVIVNKGYQTIVFRIKTNL